MAYERFVDRKDTKDLMQDCPDFVLRRHGLPSTWIVYSFIIVLLLILIMVNYLTITLILLPKDSPVPLDNILLFLLTIAILLTGVAIFSYNMVNKIRDIILKTEFQNLLFASSAAVNSEFCMISTGNKKVIYYDYGFDRIFPSTSDDKSQDTMERFLAHAGLSDSDKEEIQAAIERNSKMETKLSIKSDDGTENILTIIIDPLKRPSSHVVIRGYSN